MKYPRTEYEIRFAQAQGRILHRRRNGMGMTRRELAAATGGSLNKQAIFRIEMGDQTASAFDLAVLGRALELAYAEMLPDMVLPAVVGNRVETLWTLTERCRPEGAYA